MSRASPRAGKRLKWFTAALVMLVVWIGSYIAIRTVYGFHTSTSPDITHSPANPFVPHDLLDINIEVPHPSDRIEPAVAFLAGVTCGIYKPLVTLDAHLNHTHINFLISSRKPFEFHTHAWVHVAFPTTESPAPNP